MSSAMGTILAPGSSPPWLPRDVAEGRRFAWWAAIMFLLWVLIWFVIAIAAMVVWVVDDGRGPGMLLLGLIGFIAMVVCFMSAIFLKKTVLDAIDQGRFHDAKNDSMVWIIFTSLLVLEMYLQVCVMASIIRFIHGLLTRGCPGITSGYLMIRSLNWIQQMVTGRILALIVIQWIIMEPTNSRRCIHQDIHQGYMISC